MEQEIWKDIAGYEGYYQVSNMGRIKSLERKVHGRRGLLKEMMLGLYPNHRGYLLVLLSKGNLKNRLIVHRLVAQHFIPNPENKPEVNHKDGNKQNNSDWNLEWFTRLENAHHSINVLGKNQRGQNHAQAKIKEEDAIEIIMLHRTGVFTYAELGRKFNLNDGHVSGIVRGKTWKHLKLLRNG
jgi:hypothetical protein